MRLKGPGLALVLYFVVVMREMQIAVCISFKITYGNIIKILRSNIIGIF